MATLDTSVILGKHLESALKAVAAKLGTKANSSDVITKGSQTLTDLEKEQARANIGAGTSDFSGKYADLPDKPAAVLYTAQSLTEDQKAQVRSNIGAGSTSFSGNYNDLSNKPTKLSDFTNDQSFATTTEVSTAIANSKHASFSIVSTLPTAANAQENILYLFKNTTTGYYDIYAKINNKLERLDDVSIDLKDYSTTTQMNSAISTATDSMLKYSAQTLTDANKTQALSNLGVALASDSDVTSMLTEIGLSA